LTLCVFVTGISPVCIFRCELTGKVFVSCLFVV